MANILAQGDKTCKGWNERADTADVDADKQLSVVTCKLWEQNCAWHVTDNLTGKGRENERVFLQKEAEKVLYRIYPCHISRKNEEENEGEEQRIVNLGKRASVHKNQHKRN